MDPIREQIDMMTRRHFFGRTRASAWGRSLWPACWRRPAWPGHRRPGQARCRCRPAGLPGLPHFAPKAKRAIYLHMNGGPSQMDLFDYKPKMDAVFDKDLPDSIRKGQRLTTMTSGQSRFPIAPSKYKFAQHGKSGMWVSELLALDGQDRRRDRADQDGLDRGDQPRPGRHLHLHRAPAPRPGEPGLVAQLRPGHDEPEPAGLRGDDRDLVEQGRRPGPLQPALARGLPAQQVPGRGPALQGRPGALPVQSRRASTPPPAGASLDAINRLNQREFESIADPETQARIAQYEMAFRMQTSVPELTDISNEPKHILDMYGPDVHTPGTLRPLLPAGPPAGRARRPVRPDLPPRLGPARQHGRRPARASARTSTRRATP